MLDHVKAPNTRTQRPGREDIIHMTLVLVKIDIDLPTATRILIKKHVTNEAKGVFRYFSLSSFKKFQRYNFESIFNKNMMRCIQKYISEIF